MNAGNDFFRTEERTCGNCGETWDAVAFWDTDMDCGGCRRKAWQIELAAINDERDYEVATIGGAMPTQATGRFADTRPFYFRARHGSWWLRVGLPDWPIEYVDWPDLDGDHIVATGDDASHGDMATADVLAILDAYAAAGGAA